MMRDRALAAADPHKADLVWQPWEHLENSWEKQRQGKERAPVNREQGMAGWWAGGQAGGQMGRLGPTRPSTERDFLLPSRCSGESSG